MRRKPLCGLMMVRNTVLIAQKKIGHGIMRKWDMSNGYYTVRSFKDRPIKSLYNSISDMGIGESFKYPLDTVRLVILCQ